MFAGDIMGHRSQIVSAYNNRNNKYMYDEVFSEIAEIFKKADFSIANLELTFGGKPYSGFPKFSSPDSLAVAIKKANINVLVTANNHSADRGCKGIQRTISILNQNGILHTGTFSSKQERDSKNLLILEKDDLKVGLLNYTQDINDIYLSQPCIVNLIDKNLIKKDIENAKIRGIDKLIVFLHWGEQYNHYPNRTQKRLANYLLNSGVDIIIGSHPHVLQPIYCNKDNNLTINSIVAYSLGNFISNQRRKGRDGGVILQIDIQKENNTTIISDAKYYFTWVDRYYSKGKRRYKIVPYMFESGYRGYNYKMKRFLKDSKRVLSRGNIKQTSSFRESQRALTINYFKREVTNELVVP